MLPVAIEIREKVIEWQMEKRLEDGKDLQTVVIPQEKIVWIEEHEIWINNHMFDISSFKLKNGVYTFTGLYDEDETELVMDGMKYPEKHPQENRELARIVDSLLHLYFKDYQELNREYPVKFSYPFLCTCKLPDTYHPVFTPPPQCC